MKIFIIERKYVRLVGVGKCLGGWCREGGGEPRIHSEYQVKDLDLELKRGKTQARLENSAYAARTQGTQPSSTMNCKGTVVTYGKGLQQ